MSGVYEQLKLENQLCFPLYACSRELVRQYQPYLSKYDLTYTQYIVLMVLWQQQEVSVSALGRKLYLDSGTLSPLLKKMQAKGLLQRNRSSEDERSVIISITQQGMDLQEELKDVPAKVGSCIKLSGQEIVELYSLLHKALEGFENE